MQHMQEVPVPSGHTILSPEATQKPYKLMLPTHRKSVTKPCWQSIPRQHTCRHTNSR
jgi:hypothetical protein